MRRAGHHILTIFCMLLQGVTTLGTLYSGSLFPGRCPEGKQMLLNFYGGATNRKVLEQSEEEIIKQARLKPDRHPAS